MTRVMLRQNALCARLELSPELSGLTALASMELMPCSESGWRWASAPLALPALTKLQVALPIHCTTPCSIHTIKAIDASMTMRASKHRSVARLPSLASVDVDTLFSSS